MEQQPWMVSISLVIFIVLYLLQRSGLDSAMESRDKHAVRLIHITSLFLSLMFCLFALWNADWFHYLEGYKEIKETGDSISIEPFYVFVIYYLSPSYLVFRFLNWGIGLMFVYKTFSVCKLNRYVALFMFSTTWMIWFSYSRVSFAMSLVFLGAALCAQHVKENRWYILLGLTIILLGSLTHKSAFFGCFVILLSFLVSALGRKALIAILCISPVLIIIAATAFNSFDFLYSVSSNDLTSQASRAGLSYMSGVEDDGKDGFGLLVAQILERTPYYILMVVCIIAIIKNRVKDITPSVRVFMYILIFIVLFSSVFAFNMGVSTDVFYGRFLRFAFIPSVIVITYFYEKGWYPRTVKYTYLIAFLSSIYQIIYSFYLFSVL